MKRLSPADLEEIKENSSLRIELAYAQENNLLFGERIYRKEAKLWAHRDMAKIILQAAQIVYAQGYRLIVYDCLRTTDAQQKMLETQRVKDNPHWLEEPRLLSPPGAGAHPRAMAVDVSLETQDGTLVDMGTPFDFLAQNAAAEHNPAHRDHPNLSAQVRVNRRILEDAMLGAAKTLKFNLMVLPQEWWDFRFPSFIYNSYAPLSDKDLPQEMKITE